MTRHLPLTYGRAALIRTDFTDHTGWAELLAYLATERSFPELGEFSVDVDPIDDRQYDGMGVGELLAAAPNEDANFDMDTGEVSGGPSAYAGDGSAAKLHTYAYLADAMTFAHPERPILAVNFYLDHGEHFRLTAASMVPVETNLAIANIGFNEYVTAAEASPDGILRDDSFD